MVRFTDSRPLIRCPPSNPNEKNILYRLFQLLRLNCRLVFVFDGARRPEKRSRFPRQAPHEHTRLLKGALEHMGIPWHMAPGEAEAECAQLQKQGIVDAVWTEDGGALMFGATGVIQFFRISNNGENHDPR
jgi:holliday junction resolvase YEN1